RPDVPGRSPWQARSCPTESPGGQRQDRGAAESRSDQVLAVSCLLGCFALGVVQVRASQGRRGRDVGPYRDWGERCEVRAWAARNVKSRRRGTSSLVVLLRRQGGYQRMILVDQAKLRGTTG